jgi:hypothetical protein
MKLQRKQKNKNKVVENQAKTLVKPKFMAINRKFSLFLSDQYAPSLTEEILNKV